MSPEGFTAPGPSSDAERALLLGLTSIPTAAGREDRVESFVRAWLDARPGLASSTDAHGNIEVRFADAPAQDDAPPPVYFTAHMDHPAFVVERVIGPGTLELAFRGGVMDPYFENAAVEVFASFERMAGAISSGGVWDEPSVVGRLVGRGDQEKPFKSYVFEADDGGDPAGLLDTIGPGDVGRWRLPAGAIAEEDLTPLGTDVRGDVLRAHACDDLAAAAAMMAAMDRLLAVPAGDRVDARLLFTRAEEIGFVGAIGASRDGLMPRGSKIIALENSRSFPGDSPIGGGPIVRVGDRISTFSPGLTAAVSKVAEKAFGRPSTPRANQTEADFAHARKWQRKLMAGGACEASVFARYGADPARGLAWESTCVCLPLGNYHNMAELSAVQAGTNASPPAVGQEFIALDDWDGMVALLEACGRSGEGGLGAGGEGGTGDEILTLFEGLWDDRRFVLGAGS